MIILFNSDPRSEADTFNQQEAAYAVSEAAEYDREYKAFIGPHPEVKPFLSYDEAFLGPSEEISF